MKNVTVGRFGGFMENLFKPSSWSVWRPAKEASSWSVRRPAGFQDLPLFNKARHPELVSGSTEWVVGCTGFTLMELLVVVLIIGILATVALPQYQMAVEKSRVAEARSMIQSIAQAREVYRLANGEFPTSFRDIDIRISSKVEDDSSCMSTKNWEYCIDTDSIEADPKNLSGERRYILTYYPNTGEVPPSVAGKLTCYFEYPNTPAEKFCRSFGGQLDDETGEYIMP